MSRNLVILGLALVAFLLMFGCTQPQPVEDLPPYGQEPAYAPEPTFPSARNVSATPKDNATSAPFELDIIDVGFGDSALIRTNNFTMLFDAGSAKSADKLAHYLRSKKVDSIDVLVLSSTDPDNVGGAPAIIRQFAVKEVWAGNKNSSSQLWYDIKKQLGFTPITPVTYGYSRSLGKLEITALNPQADMFTSNPDTDSVALKVAYGNFCALLFSSSEASGAAGSDPGTVVGGIESRIAIGYVPVKCQVLQVSKHGSGNSASFQLLERAQPEIAVISVGPNPPAFSYPEPATIRRLMLKNISVYTTHKLGTISFSSDGIRYDMKTEVPVGEEYMRFINKVYATKLYWDN